MADFVEDFATIKLNNVDLKITMKAGKIKSFYKTRLVSVEPPAIIACCSGLKTDAFKGLRRLRTTDTKIVVIGD